MRKLVFFGKPVEELSKEQLIECLTMQTETIEHLREENMRDQKFYSLSVARSMNGEQNLFGVEYRPMKWYDVL